MDTVNCRRQKMKCRIDDGKTCRRCRRAGLRCVFVPRANACAVMLPGSLSAADFAPSDIASDLLQRVKIIEEHLGLSRYVPFQEEAVEVGPGGEILEEDDDMSALWDAASRLEKAVPRHHDARLWNRVTLKHLWQAYAISLYRTILAKMADSMSQIQREYSWLSFSAEKVTVFFSSSSSPRVNSLLLQRAWRPRTGKHGTSVLYHTLQCHCPAKYTQ